MTLRRLLRRARLILGRRHVERSMAAELQYHIDCEIADRVARGLPPDEARRTALRDFGGVERVKEDARDARGTRLVQDALADAGYACRVLRHNPAFTAAATLTFALGIGAAAAIFTLVYGVLLRPLPYADPDRLAVIWEHDTAHARPRNVVSADNFLAWRERSRRFAAMAAVVPTSVTHGEGPTAERLVGAEISPEYFGVLGVAPALGRDFEARDAAGRVVLLSDALWRRRFGEDPALVGRTIRLSGEAYVVAGVMPRAFDPPRLSWLGEQALWFPLSFGQQHRSWGRAFIVVGRLADGVSLDDARSEMTAIADARAREETGNRGWSVTLVPLAEQITGHVRLPLAVLLGAVLLLLAIAVANVGTLTLALVRRRSHELAVRRAIGATERRLFGQVFWQSAVLGVAGTAAGLAAAWIGVRVLLDLIPADVPRAADIRLDLPVLLSMAAVASLATLVVGTLVAFRGTAASRLASSPQDAGLARTSSATGGRALVVAEVALALALSLMSVLMIRSFVALRQVDLGFHPGGVVLARVALPGGSQQSAASHRERFGRLMARVRALPGVAAAGLISTRPFGGMSTATTVRDSAAADRPSLVADVRYADAAIFRTLGIALTDGEAFDDRDLAAAGAVVSASLARTLWPGEPAVGRTLAIALNDGVTARVSGVVEDVHLFDARTAARPALYLSTARFPSSVRDLAVRVDGDAASIVPTLRAAIAEVEPGLPLYAVRLMPDLVDESLASDRFTTVLLSAFGAVALALAAIGIVGVLTGEVRARRREIGIRLALGSSGGRVAMLFIGRTVGRAAIGIGLGSILALTLARGMTTLVFGISAADPISLVAVILIVLLVALAATVVPTLRAIRTSPLEALREG